MPKAKEKIEFGDFQTPLDLAYISVEQISNLDKFDRLIEPTCGEGTFLIALLRKNVPLSRLEGWEINPTYVDKANLRISEEVSISGCAPVKEQDFFSTDLSNIDLSDENILFIGNPPWVTNSELGRLLSNNVPSKANFQGLSGLDAMTGKSNFDISEWILIQLLHLISGKSSSIAFLVKTSVARKVFEYSCKNSLDIHAFKIKHIDAKKHFDVSVDACLLLAAGGLKNNNNARTLEIYSEVSDSIPQRTMGYVNGKLVADILAYERLSSIDTESEFRWRSGVKHDASKIMEFNLVDGALINGKGEKVSLPSDYLYPMYKSSHISKSELPEPSKFMLVTQKRVGNSTSSIKLSSPETWEYLESNSEKLDSRKSSLYKTSPRFSVFGVGSWLGLVIG